MSNQTEKEQKLAVLVGDGYATATIPQRSEMLLAAIDKMTIPERVMVLESALVPSGDEASSEALVAEVADLKARLAASEQGNSAAVKDAVAKALAGVEKDVERRASDRAVEIMAGVGQVAPIGGFPTDGLKEGTGKASALDANDAVAASYRQKYGIS